MARDAARARSRISVNRAPVLTLWAAVVAQRLGFAWDEALTLGRAVAGLNAYSKGKALGLFHPKPAEVRKRRKAPGRGKPLTVHLLSRAVTVRRTPEGLRALAKGKPVSPEGVEAYVEAKFGADYSATRKAMQALARSLPREALASRAYRLYESFRPAVPGGRRGWGKAGVLSLSRIRRLASSAGGTTR